VVCPSGSLRYLEAVTPWFAGKSTDQAPEEQSLADVLAEAERRVSAVGVAAREAAERIGADCERFGATSQDEQHLVTDLLHALADRAGGLQRDADELARILDRASDHLGSTSGSQDDEAPEPLGQEPIEVPGETVPAWRPSYGGFMGKVRRRQVTRDDRPLGLPVIEGMRFIATQMAAAGSSREEIVERLRREFDVDDPSELLSDVLGMGAR
jgi:hypothetical protein